MLKNINMNWVNNRKNGKPEWTRYAPSYAVQVAVDSQSSDSESANVQVFTSLASD
jgi:hypothetical protein